MSYQQELPAPTASRHDDNLTIAKENFPLVLHAMLDDIDAKGNTHIVSWQPHGRCFVVHIRKTFVEQIMPIYFRMSKFASFQRQLNLYGFRRITKGLDKGGNYHDLFRRGRRDLCVNIRRVQRKGTGKRKPDNPALEPNFYLEGIDSAADGVTDTKMPPLNSLSRDVIAPGTMMSPSIPFNSGATSMAALWNAFFSVQSSTTGYTMQQPQQVNMPTLAGRVDLDPLLASLRAGVEPDRVLDSQIALASSLLPPNLHQLQRQAAPTVLGLSFVLPQQCSDQNSAQFLESVSSFTSTATACNEPAHAFKSDLLMSELPHRIEQHGHGQPQHESDRRPFESYQVLLSKGMDFHQVREQDVVLSSPSRSSILRSPSQLSSSSHDSLSDLF